MSKSGKIKKFKDFEDKSFSNDFGKKNSPKKNQEKGKNVSFPKKNRNLYTGDWGNDEE